MTNKFELGDRVTHKNYGCTHTVTSIMHNLDGTTGYYIDHNKNPCTDDVFEKYVKPIEVGDEVALPTVVSKRVVVAKFTAKSVGIDTEYVVTTSQYGTGPNIYRLDYATHWAEETREYQG